MTTWIRQGAGTAQFNAPDNARDKNPARTRFVLAGIGLVFKTKG